MEQDVIESQKGVVVYAIFFGLKQMGGVGSINTLGDGIIPPPLKDTDNNITLDYKLKENVFDKKFVQSSIKIRLGHLS